MKHIVKSRSKRNFRPENCRQKLSDIRVLLYVIQYLKLKDKGDWDQISFIPYILFCQYMWYTNINIWFYMYLCCLCTISVHAPYCKFIVPLLYCYCYSTLAYSDWPLGTPQDIFQNIIFVVAIFRLVYRLIFWFQHKAIIFIDTFYSLVVSNYYQQSIKILNIV